MRCEPSLLNFRRSDLSGPSLSEEIRNLRQIQEQGWNPSLFEGLFLNSSHLEELKRNPHHYGRILGDHDVVDPEKGIHVLLDADKTLIVELAPFAFSQLLANQSQGVPDATIQVGEGVWAFPTLENRAARSPANDKPATRPGSGRTVFTPRAMLADSHADTIATTIGMKLKLIPAGEFRMGSTEADNEKPRHLVTIARPFYLGVYPVTQRENMLVAKENPSHFSGNDRLPVESVSWFDAVTFCNALSQKDGLPPFYKINGKTVQVPDWSGPGYRLPTEAEWEYACRAGTNTRFLFGNDENALGQYAWYSANSGSKTHPVGEKKPNAFGLHDMHGNVWEWCWDGYDANYYGQSRAKDPRGPEAAVPRVFRGGSWDCGPLLRGPRPGASTSRCSGTITWASAWPELKQMVELGGGAR